MTEPADIYIADEFNEETTDYFFEMVDLIHTRFRDPTQMTITTFDSEPWRPVDSYGKYVPKEIYMDPKWARIYTLTEENFMGLEKRILADVNEVFPKKGSVKGEGAGLGPEKGVD